MSSRWSAENKAYAVSLYIESGSAVEAVRDLVRKVGEKRGGLLTRQTIYNRHKKFQSQGTVHGLHSTTSPGDGHSGRLRSARSAQNIQQVGQIIEEGPQKSLRLISQEIRGMCKESVRTILRKDIGLYPYRISVKQKLSDGDVEKRVVMCQ